MKPLTLIGYSGHAFVVYEAFESTGRRPVCYTDRVEKDLNPYQLEYMGSESDQKVVNELKQFDYFVSIGDNALRKMISDKLVSVLGKPINAIHNSALVSRTAVMGNGCLMAPGVKVNALATIGDGVICNTGSIVEHECRLDDFVHIAPSAVLCGNVTVGQNSFIGANAVVKQGIQIGKNVIVGAGTVVVKDLPDNVVVIGNPQKSR